MARQYCEFALIGSVSFGVGLSFIPESVTASRPFTDAGSNSPHRIGGKWLITSNAFHIAGPARPDDRPGASDEPPRKEVVLPSLQPGDERDGPLVVDIAQCGECLVPQPGT
jgi:hypothetical protein